MYRSIRRQSGFQSTLNIFELIYHETVRKIRAGHHNAFVSLLQNILTTVAMIMAFLLLFKLLGMSSPPIRGDYMLYILSGIFLYLTHVKSMGATAGAQSGAGGMMQHAPMNNMIAIVAGALSALYTQTVTLVVILFFYHTIWTPITIEDPLSAYGMILIAWFTGISVGLVMMAIKPWAPVVVSLFKTIYQRANMIASGKMFVANALPTSMIAMFDWNPLFHIIDQCRGYTFVNYLPRNSDYMYSVYLGGILFMLGLMGEFYTRQHMSQSWGAKG